jgi:RES domain-containing protein
MILTEFGPVTAYRMHTPRWATSPNSGAGAYQQLSPLMPPGRLVSYTVRLSQVADFRAGYNTAQWSALWEEFFCDWRELWFNQRTEPPSWVLAEQAISAGAKGMLFASKMSLGGTNLVVYTDALSPDDMLTVYDPTGALPKNQASWR